jgi:hypothetical protein
MQETRLHAAYGRQLQMVRALVLRLGGRVVLTEAEYDQIKRAEEPYIQINEIPGSRDVELVAR